jgi:hypothetical protein
VRPDDDTLNHPTGTGDHDSAQGTGDTDRTDAADLDDLDPDGAPCLVCGQTVPGPNPALLCPDCSEVAATIAPDGTTAPDDTAPDAR